MIWTTWAAGTCLRKPGEKRASTSAWVTWPDATASSTQAKVASAVGPSSTAGGGSAGGCASGGVRIDIEMTKTAPRQIAGLLFKPASAEAPPKTYGDAVAILEKAGGKSQLFVGELVKGAKACVPRQNHNTTQSLALGSTMKLWVLLALDEKLRVDKKLSWDTKLAIRDAGKSLPSGTMQDEAAGTEHTLREFATQMISISDNTATDHLIDFVGDAAMEKALTLAKHGAPATNTPFLRTRELFGLKLAATPDELAAYRKANVAGKRKLLAALRTRPIALEQAIKDWGDQPRALDLEWFGDGRDLCNVMAALAARGKLSPSLMHPWTRSTTCTAALSATPTAAA